VKLSAYLKGIFKQKITKNKRKKLPESLLPRWIKRLVPLNVEPRVNSSTILIHASKTRENGTSSCNHFALPAAISK
jgi:predicted component of type VI protein secretion system